MELLAFSVYQFLFLFKGGLESSVPAGMESRPRGVHVLLQPKHLECLSAGTQARSSWIRSNSTEATGADFGSPCDVSQMLFVGTEEHQRHGFGIQSSNTGILGHSQMPTASHRTQACCLLICSGENC